MLLYSTISFIVSASAAISARDIFREATIENNQFSMMNILFILVDSKVLKVQF